MSYFPHLLYFLNILENYQKRKADSKNFKKISKNFGKEWNLSNKFYMVLRKTKHFKKYRVSKFY